MPPREDILTALAGPRWPGPEEDPAKKVQFLGADAAADYWLQAERVEWEYRGKDKPRWVAWIATVVTTHPWFVLYEVWDELGDLPAGNEGKTPPPEQMVTAAFRILRQWILTGNLDNYRKRSKLPPCRRAKTS